MIKSQFFLTCGNSSVVEHDLAKVGVASSNLVSRSIFFLLTITTLLTANITDTIAEAVLVEFEAKYPCLDANLPKVKPASPLPRDFKEYKFLMIDLKPSQLRKRKGIFKVIFKTKDREKILHYRFEIDGTIDVFKAKHKLYNDKIISKNDYEKVKQKIDKLPSKIIACNMPKKLMSKNYISAGSILTMNKFKYKKDVLRGTHIRAFIRDGMLVLEIEATVLQDGDIGEVVKIKTNKGKIFHAKLISKYKAIILE